MLESVLQRGVAPEASVRETVCEVFEKAVRHHGANPLIIFDDGSSLSYSDAGALAADIAGRLQGVGVGKGDRVLSVSAASAEAALVFWACMLIGAVFIPVDGRIQPDKLSKVFKSTAPKIVFTGHGWAGAFSGVKVVSYSAESGVAHGSRFHEFLDESGSDYRPEPVSPADDAVVLFTSGTSGEPNGIVLSHGALSGSARLMAETYQWGPEDRVFSIGDFHTMSGLRNTCVATFYPGASFIIAPQDLRASGPACSVLMERLGATILCAVPAFLAQFTRFQEKISGGFAKSLRFVMCTGTLLTPSIVESFEERYKRRVLNYYGLTETSGLCIGVIPGMKREYPGSIGVPLGCSVMIAGPDGREAAPGAAGELFIRTENIMSGYYNDPSLTEKAIVGGWFRTKDFCRQEPDGSIELLGRVDDAFKDLRGELVHPSEIESVLEASPLALEAAVCGFEAEDGRPASAAFVVASENGVDEKGLASELRRQAFAALGPYRTPAIFMVVDSLPRGTNGKILRRKLRETLP
ncbi:MAG: hypothetical protein A2V21_311755 [Deltaproteobacteria bacterium GWC2_55_46]|nr:MAG: hypothetical protein A2Z79_11515 [Deltaproteobacteria bacterium GWA2_55_82]OGQ63497.1 MAG: hypothetical protein A3I81_05700 [Deltaproteobacteria bacterium RIFCSPLOWO2_02_FULL_55_12]OIJ74877.1 MAG: hypothetical protein A2V21_311755 [Deltaproteobacteria bacterium GWC2_55_46]